MKLRNPLREDIGLDIKSDALPYNPSGYSGLYHYIYTLLVDIYEHNYESPYPRLTDPTDILKHFIDFLYGSSPLNRVFHIAVDKYIKLSSEYNKLVDELGEGSDEVQSLYPFVVLYRQLVRSLNVALNRNDYWLPSGSIVVI